MPGTGDAERSFDEEIRQDIIPGFPQESKWFFSYVPRLETDRELVREKWFGYKPNAPNGQGFADDPPKKRRRKTPAASGDNVIDIEDDAQGSSKAKKGKRVKRALSEESEGDGNEEDVPFDVCVFLNVETPPPPIARVGNRPVKKMTPKVTARGPFLFSSSKNYDDFLAMISHGVGARPDCLVKSSMEWRFDRPVNSSRKPIMNKTGFTVMMSGLRDRKKDWQITVLMAPPVKDVEDVVSPLILIFYSLLTWYDSLGRSQVQTMKMMGSLWTMSTHRRRYSAHLVTSQSASNRYVMYSIHY